MIKFDQYIFHIFVFLPLVAAIFIALIPSAEKNSKKTLSQIFSLFGFLAFLRIFWLFLNDTIAPETIVSFGAGIMNINFTLFISKYNIFLFGTTSAALAANTFFKNDVEQKRIIQHISPFLLAFFLYISFGQNELRVALPLLSIANFLIYFLIGFSNNTRRGSTIFQMGVFIVACDAISLILLQTKFPSSSSLGKALFSLLLIIPGFARLCLPLFAPFTRKLIQNVNGKDGPYIIIFQQLAGFLILILAKNELTELSPLFVLTISIITITGAFYVALAAVFDHKIKIISSYFLIYYSSLTALILFISLSDEFWFVVISLFISNIAIFFLTAHLGLILDEFVDQSYLLPTRKLALYLSLSMLAGLPGFGMGTCFWNAIYSLLATYLKPKSLFMGPVLLSLIGWPLALLILSFALLISMKEAKVHVTLPEKVAASPPPGISVLWFPLAILLVTWFLPFITYYTLNN